MRIVVGRHGADQEIDLRQYSASATLADLSESVFGARPGPQSRLWVDDRAHVGGDRLSDVLLLEGAQITEDRRVRPTPLHGWTISITGGLDAGRTYPLALRQRVRIGRSGQSDIVISSNSASRRHAELEVDDEGVRVRDAGSGNGTFIDGVRIPAASPRLVRPADIAQAGGGVVVRVGDDSLTLRFNVEEPLAPPPGSLHNVTATGTAPFNRPPRPRRDVRSRPIESPNRKEPSPPARFTVVTILAPLLMAGGLVVATRSLMYAAIALLAPLAAVWGYFDQKRRHRKDLKAEASRFETALRGLREQIDDAGAQRRVVLRGDLPDPVVALRTAALPTTHLWQRRARDQDHLALHCGVGNLPWTPELDSRMGRVDDDVQAVADRSTIPSAPIPVDLSDAGVVGIVGDRAGALALARSLLCQAAVHCGPADLTIGVFCDPGREEDWSWTAWLPHTHLHRAGEEGQWLSAQKARSEVLLRSLRDDVDKGDLTPLVLMVVDSEVLTEGRDAAARSLLGAGRQQMAGLGRAPISRVSGIVLAHHRQTLPASVNTVVTVDKDTRVAVDRLDGRPPVEDVVLAGLSVATARDCARDLARFEDPELSNPDAALPSMVRLPSLLGMPEISADAIRRNWASSRRIDTPVGIGGDGPFTVDLVRDGPHGLVGGTTGSGKSEFLRTLVAGLAARTDPTRLTFILIDFKGGAAFAACDRLPHTIGTVSNLDEQLADRALRALEAELRYRQRVFSEAGEGIDNLDAYLATNPAEPMPRLLVVIDEFAMLAKDYPDVLTSLVKVAAVGRTLGVHMILATQRPAGVVNDDILANTNLRVALRVQSREDSSNVIGVPAASAISRTQTGRGYVKLGQDDITAVQTALVTGWAMSGPTALVEVRPFGFGEPPAAQNATPGPAADEATDLDLLIGAIVDADRQLGNPPPRPVWPEPLGERVELAATCPAGHTGPVVGSAPGPLVRIGLSDDPDRQRQLEAAWHTDRGNLLLVGIPGSGTTTTLASIALTLAAERSPDELDLMVLDLGTGDLAALEDLPHTTSYVRAGPGTAEQRARFLTYLRQELDRRRAGQGTDRRLVVLVDGLAALRDEYGEDSEGLKLLACLYAAYADGSEVGMHFAITTSRAKAVPTQIDEVTVQKWLFRLTDPYDYVGAGLDRKQVPAPLPGRCVPRETKLQTHIAATSLPLSEAVARVGARWEHAERKAPVIGRLPESVGVDELGVVADVGGEPWRIPVGIREADLKPGWLEVFEGEHLLVAGPARAGKSTVLLALVEVIRRGAAQAGAPVAVWGICGRRSPLATADVLDRVAASDDEITPLLAAARVHRGPLVLLCDDAERFDDSDQAIQGLLGARRTDLLVIAAGRSDDLRTMYSHWTKIVRKSKSGILLQPNVDYDGELFGKSLPRRAPVALTTARGYACVSGEYELVQVCTLQQVHVGRERPR